MFVAMIVGAIEEIGEHGQEFGAFIIDLLEIGSGWVVLSLL